MPQIRYYVVKQEREVKVTASSPEDAARIATAAFTNGQNSDNGVIGAPDGVWGNTCSSIQTTRLVVRREP